jgi:membrane protein
MAKREKINRFLVFLKKDLWQIPLDELTPVRAFFVRQLQIFIVAVRGLTEDNIYLRASALTFFSLLSLVPVIAMAFGIATGFGLQEYLVAQLEQAFIGREDVLAFLLEFSESLLETAQGGTMAAVGLGILFFTVMKVLGHIEESFNEIWQVRKERTFSRKFTDYFAIMLVAPFFVILSNIVTVYLTTQIELLTLQIRLLGFFSPLILNLLRLIPFFLVWIMLTVLYIVMPNTRVKFTSAFIAGIIAGTVFQLVQFGYIYFQVGVTRYSAIYGSFAALPLLMFWMQISWVVVLFGAELAFANQNIEHYEFENESLHMSPRNRRLVTLYITHLIVRNFENGALPLNAKQISKKLRLPIRLTRDILNELAEIRILSEVRTQKIKEPAYQPATDINKMSVKYVTDQLDSRGIDYLFARQAKEIIRLKAVLESFDKCIENNPENLLLKDI